MQALTLEDMHAVIFPAAIAIAAAPTVRGLSSDRRCACSSTDMGRCPSLTACRSKDNAFRATNCICTCFRWPVYAPYWYHVTYLHQTCMLASTDQIGYMHGWLAVNFTASQADDISSEAVPSLTVFTHAPC